MHNCLLVSEVVANVTNFVLGYGDTHRDWRSLAALARTCKALHEPALDTLWRTQVDILYLIKCIPEDAWEERDLEFRSIDGWQRKLYFTRPLVRSDFQQIAHLTTRIRVLVFLPSKPHALGNFSTAVRCFPRPAAVLSGDAYEELSRCLSTAFMPKLRIVVMSDPMREEIYRAPFLFSPTLVAIHVISEARQIRVGGAHYAQGILCSALSQLPRATRNLERLSIAAFAEHSADVDIPILPDVFANLRTLRLVHFACVSPSFRAFTVLRSLPRLQELICDISRRCDLVVQATNASEDTRTQPGPSFPSLTTFSLASDSFFSSAAVLSLYPLPTLQRFNTSVCFDAPGVLFRALHDRLDHAVLKYINLCRRDTQYGGGASGLSVPVSGHMLAPLFAFSGLVDLCMWGRMELTDGDVLSMATAWPKLKRLSVFSPNDENPPRVTLRGLQYLVERCPALRYIGLSFNMMSLPADVSSSLERDRESTETPQTPIRGAANVVQNLLVTHICVGVFTIDGMTCEEVAQALVALFPNIRAINTSKDGLAGGIPALWKEVETHFPNP